MRKIIVSMWVTLDGFVAGPNDEMNWLKVDDELLRYERELVEQAGALLLGRNTYDDFADAWPTVARDMSVSDAEREYAQRVDTMEKIVVSRSGDAADWRNSRRLDNLEIQTVLDLKSESGNDLVVYGSLSVVNALAHLGLVDAYHLLVHPSFLGEGKPLFTNQHTPVGLEFESALPFRSGVVLIKYRSATGVPDSGM